MLDREYPSRLRAKLWWFFTILSVVTLACVSCNDAPQQTSSSQGKTVQSPPTKAVTLPLTDSAPPQGDVTPTVSVPPPHVVLTIAAPTTSYEAESSQNTLTGIAGSFSCSGCSGGYRVCCLSTRSDGQSGTLQFNNIKKSIAGGYQLTVYYTEGNPRSRIGYVSVNGGPAITFTGVYTGGWGTVETVNMTINLNAGNNTIKCFNPNGAGPDIDRIVV